jgi:hypothetical protein
MQGLQPLKDAQADNAYVKLELAGQDFIMWAVSPRFQTLGSISNGGRLP